MKTKPKSRKIDEGERQAAWDELARLLIRGATHKQAAEHLGFHYQTIQGWLKHPEFKAKLERTKRAIFDPPKDATAIAITEDIRELIKKYAREAVQHMWVLMKTAEAESVQLSAAKELADRSPETQKTKQVHVEGKVALFTPQDLVLMAQTAKEIQEDMGFGYKVLPAPIDESLALPIEAEPFEDQ